MIAVIYEQLTLMRLHAMKNELMRQQTLPAVEALSFEERLAMLVQYQLDAKNDAKTRRLLKAATLRDTTASLKHIHFTPARNLERALIARLSNCSFIPQNQHMLLTGATGTGKSWIASAFGREACMRGYSVKCYRLPRLLVELSTSRADGTFFKLMQNLKKPNLLILDDFGLQKLDPESCRDLLEVIEDRYMIKKPLIITSQLPVNKWIEIFKDLTIADAIMDRIVHNCFMIELKGPSLRGNDIPKTTEA
ncbi:MAG: IS21-like element helper ATPase IstB [Sphaerochaetaceae bacterium]|nr:IS21-like element helper ATPase IstB [Sphaerochaetaceae bacterium]